METVIVAGEVIEREVVITTTPAPDAEPPPPMKRLMTITGPSDIPTLDPQLATDGSSLALLNEMYVGLTRLHEEKAVVEPAMATSWDVSVDGLTYTFHIRTDIPWVRWNGDAVEEVLDEEGHVRYVTAADFTYGIKRECDPAVAADYGYVFAVIEGCSAFIKGEGTAEEVKVAAPDSGTLVVTFTQPAVYNLNIIGMWIGSAVPQWAIETQGDRWTEPGFSQSYGPYALKEWLHDSYAVIVRNPFWPEDMATVPHPKIEEIEFRFLDVVPAFAEYEAGGMDFSLVPLTDLDRVKANPVLSEELYIAPHFCTGYMGINTQAEHVSDARVRRALSLALDRQSLVDNVFKGGQEPAGWFSRPGLAGAPTRQSHPDLGVSYDPDAARAFLDEYLAEQGITAADIDLTVMGTSNSRIKAASEAIQQMWADALGIRVNLVFQEWKVYLQTVRSEAVPDLFSLGWCVDYPDANNFITNVFSAGGLANQGGGGINWTEGEDYDAWRQILTAAAVETNPARRQELYAQAEQILVYEKAAVIPMYWGTTVSVTKPYVERTYSVTNQQAFEKWDIDMSAQQ